MRGRVGKGRFWVIEFRDMNPSPRGAIHRSGAKMVGDNAVRSIMVYLPGRETAAVEGRWDTECSSAV